MFSILFFLLIVLKAHFSISGPCAFFLWFICWKEMSKNEINCYFVWLFFQASMLTNPDGPFINLSRLNMAKYSQKPNLSRVRL